MMVIAAPVAVRILQLRSISDDENAPCDNVLETDEWQCLFVHTHPGKPLPGKPPSAKWAYYAIANLAGWSDSKRTGKVGWQTLWKGWSILQNQLSGWRAAMQLARMDR